MRPAPRPSIKKTESLTAARAWDEIIDFSARFRVRYGHTDFYGRVAGELEQLTARARRLRENRVTLAQRYLPGADFQGCADTTLDGTSTEDRRRNFGGNAELRAGADGRLNALIRFDLTEVPAHARVYKAELALFCREVEGATGEPFLRAFRVIEPWEEGTSRMAVAERGATWFEPVGLDGPRTKAGNWAVYGGTVDETADFSRGPNGIVAEVPLAAGRFVTLDITRLAQDWVARRSPNCGVLLRTGPDAGADKNVATFCSGNHAADPGRRPRLMLHYKGAEDDDYSTLETLAFEGYPGIQGRIEMPGTAGITPHFILIRESSAARGERSAAWRGRVGVRDRTLHRVLVMLDGVMARVPAGGRVTGAVLRLPIRRVDPGRSGGSVRLEIWPVAARWDPTGVDWNEAAAGRPWQMPGCGGREDRDPVLAASAEVAGPDSGWLVLDLTAACDRIARGEAPDHGFVLTIPEGANGCVEFGVGGDDGPGPVFTLDHHLAGAAGFRPVFDPAAGQTWTRASEARCEFRNGVINMPPGAGLVTRGAVYTDFVLCGAVKRSGAQGTAGIVIRHAALGAYRVVIGTNCGVLYDPGGDLPAERLWTAAGECGLEDWVPFQVAVNAGTLFVAIGAERSGPLAGLRLGTTEIMLTAEGGYMSVREFVAGRRRTATAAAAAAR